MDRIKSRAWVFSIAFLATASASAEGWPTTVEAIAQYRGEDRQQMLEAGAEKEGQLVYYTSNSNEAARNALIAGFKRKYPDIEVSAYRASSQDIELRIRQEAAASRATVSVLEGGSTYQALIDADLLLPYWSPSADNVDRRLVLEAGDGLYWAVPGGMTVSMLAYNTDLLSDEDVPRDWVDLANPVLQGKMAHGSSGNAQADWVREGIMAMGEGFMAGLKSQGIKRLNLSSAAACEAVGSGQYAVMVMVASSCELIAEELGYPLSFVRLEPAHGFVQALYVPRNSASPHAAMLWIDWILSKEGQEIYSSFGYMSAMEGADSIALELDLYIPPFDPATLVDLPRLNELLTLITTPE